MSQWIRSGFVALTALLLTACPDESDPPGGADAFVGGSLRDQGFIGSDVGLVDAAPPVDASLDCQRDTDCAEDSYCYAENGGPGRCLVGCREGGCAAGEICNPGTRLCQAEADCVIDADCGAGQRCEDSQCVEAPPACVVDADCGADARCEAGACVPVAPPGCMGDGDCAPDERCEAGACVAVPPAGCADDTDCPPGEACVADACVAAPCGDDVDCAPGERCVAGACEAAPPQCAGDLDCGAGQRCAGGLCVEAPPGCVGDLDCAPGEICQAGACVPGAPVDACAAPRPLGLGQVQGTTVGAGAIQGASCGDGATGPEVAYRLSLPEAQTVCLNLRGSGFDTVLSVRAGLCGDPAGELACNDDDFDVTGGPQSALTLEAAANTDYFVFVDGYGDAAGDFLLSVSAGPCVAAPECLDDADCAGDAVCVAGVCEDGPPPACAADADCAEGQICLGGLCAAADDVCVGPPALAGFGEVAGTTVGAPAEQGGSCGGARAPEAAWALRFDADTTACLDLADSAFDTVLYVRAGDCLAGAEVGCNDDIGAGAPQSQLTLQAEAGVDYFVFVDGFFGGGEYTLAVRPGPCGQAPGCLADADCAAGQRCLDGACAGAPACLLDADCGLGEICDEGGRCVALPPLCLGDADCAAGEVCDAQGRCVPAAAPCVVDADCAEGAACGPDGLCVPANDGCAGALPIAAPGVFQGVLDDNDQHAPSCGGGRTGEAIYDLSLAAGGPVCLTTEGSEIDTVLSVRTACGDAASEIACNDDSPLAGGLQSAVTLAAEAGAHYTVLVDGFAAAGAYTLTVRAGACDAVACADAADCAAGEACVDGLCVAAPACVIDADCAAGEQCVAGACEAVVALAACADPAPIGFGEVQGSTADARSQTRGSCVGNGNERAWRFTTDVEATVCARTAGSGFDTGLYVRAADCAAGDEIACNDDAGGVVQSAVEFLAAPGVDYFVFLDGFAGGGDYVLTVSPGPCDGGCAVDADCAAGEACVDGACALPPCADDLDCLPGERCEAGACVAPAACAAAEVFPGGRIGGNSAGAAAQLQGSCGGEGAEVVWRFDAVAAGPVCLLTAGSSYDTVLYVRAEDCAAGAEVACNDDAFGLQSEVQFEAAADTPYYVVVDGFAGGGDYVLSGFSGACDAPPECLVDGDCAVGSRCDAGACVDTRPAACQAATPIDFGVTAGDSTLALSEVRGTCGGGGREDVRILRVDAPTRVCAQTAGSDHDTVLYVRPERCDGDVEIACDDDGGVGSSSQVAFDALPGVDYHLFVDGFATGGPWQLTVFPGECDAPPECFADLDCGAGQRCEAFACVDAAPDGRCATPWPVELGVYNGSTVGADAVAAGACGGQGESPEQVHRFVAPADGTYCASTGGSAFDTVLYVRADDCAGAELGCNDDSPVAGDVQSAVEFDATAGAAYALVVDGFTDFDGNPAAGDFTLRITAGPCAVACVVDGDCAAGERCGADGLCAPGLGCGADADCALDEVCDAGGLCVPAPDDTCAAAQPLALGQPARGDSAGLGADDRGSCGGNGPEQVFALTVAEAGLVCVTTAGSAIDTVLHVRADACRAPAAEVACSDDSALAGGLQSAVEFQADPAVAYFIFVDSFAQGGAWQVSARPGACQAGGVACVFDGDCLAGEVCQDGVCAEAPPVDCLLDADCAAGERCDAGACVPAPQDACGAIGDANLPSRTVGTLAGSNDFQGQCGGRGPEQVLAFTAPAAGTVCASTVGSSFDSLLYVREGACADGVEVACNDDAVGTRARVEFAVAAGADYFVFVDGFNGGGDYVLSLSSGACDQAPACFVDGDCAAGEVCSAAGQCEPAGLAECLVDADCAGGLTCQVGLCLPPNGGTCEAPTVIQGEGVWQGTTVGAADLHGASCGGGAASSEAVFAFAPPAGDWCVTTAGSLYDTVLHLRADPCANGAELGCSDDSAVAGGLQSALTVAAPGDRLLYLFVDGFGANSAGQFTLNVAAGACP